MPCKVRFGGYRPLLEGLAGHMQQEGVDLSDCQLDDGALDGLKVLAHFEAVCALPDDRKEATETCVCGHEIRYVYTVRPIGHEATCNIGSKCILKWLKQSDSIAPLADVVRLHRDWIRLQDGTDRCAGCARPIRTGAIMHDHCAHGRTDIVLKHSRPSAFTDSLKGRSRLSKKQVRALLDRKYWSADKVRAIWTDLNPVRTD